MNLSVLYLPEQFVNINLANPHRTLQGIGQDLELVHFGESLLMK